MFVLFNVSPAVGGSKSFSMDINSSKNNQDWKSELVRFLGEIVAIPSPSGEEKEVLDRIALELKKTGWGEIRFDRIGNLRAKIGDGKHQVAIDGHADTVGSGKMEDWECDPYQGRCRDGWIWGRGAVDQKSGLASAVYAGLIIQEEGLLDDFTLNLVLSIQEEDCEGLCWDYIIEEEGFRPEGVILTEPTNLEIKRGQLGHMEMLVTAGGESAHAFCPEFGDNAIYRMAPLIERIQAIAPGLSSHPDFGRGRISVTSITSKSPSDNSVPDACRIRIDRRFSPGETEDELIEEIRRAAGNTVYEIIVPTYRRKSHTGVLLEGKKYLPGWLVEEEDPLVCSARKTSALVMGQEVTVGTWRFSTNGVSTMGKHGIPTIGFGPGDEKMAHRPNERVLISHVIEAANFYARLPGVYCRRLN